MSIVREEVFGPIVTVIKFNANEENKLINMVNDNEYALGMFHSLFVEKCETKSKTLNAFPILGTGIMWMWEVKWRPS